MIHTIKWKKTLLMGAAAAAALMAGTQVPASSSIRDAWVARYNMSSSYTNLSNSCTLCHATGGGANWNAYGWNLRQQIHGGVALNQAFTNIEGMNSDQDPTGSTNLQEISANTQPGWTAGPNNTYYFTTSTTLNQLPATLVTGTYDPPVVLCPADIAVPHNGVVNIDDLLAVINAWGMCPAPCPPTCAADVNHDCVVNIDDLLAVINAWGPCP